MTRTVEPTAPDRSSPRDVGRNLRQVRKQQGLSRGAAARSAGLTRRELAAYERGKVEVPESDLWCLAGSCGVDVSEMLPRREPLRVSPHVASISTGDTIRQLRVPAEPDGVLREYLAMIDELRNLPPGGAVPLRQPDLTALAEALGGTSDSIEQRLVELIAASAQEAARLRAMILPPRSLSSAPPTETSRVDPYAALSQPSASPAVEEFFSQPPPVGVFTPVSRFEAPPPTGAPPTSWAPPADPTPDLGGPVASPADPFAADPATTAPVAPGVEDPSGQVTLQPVSAAPFTITPSGNGSDPGLADRLASSASPDLSAAPVATLPAVPTASPDVFAPPPPGPTAPPAADMRTPGRPAEPTIPRVIPGVARIAWNAGGDQAPTADADTATPLVDPIPRFERAGARWQIGGIFPATAMADDGTLALRRADARWALTDLRAAEDCIIEASFDFRAGSGFGIIFRGAVGDGERITGYSFDVDPIAGGGGYLLRLWEDSRQHWRPLAQSPVTDPAQLYGRHVVRLALRADQLTVSVDGEPVLDVPALSRSTVELGPRPCRGDRVGVQAWSTTEVTVESFRVASL